MDRDIGGNRRAAIGQRLEDHRAIEAAKARAAVLLRYVDRRHAEFSRLADHIDREICLFVPLEGMRGQLLLGKIQCHLLDRGLFFGWGKMHRQHSLVVVG